MTYDIRLKMSEFLLKFVDEAGGKKEISVNQDEFVIGRHSENNLTYIDSRLSREHAKIQRFGEVFILSDLGSSNGTTVNGEDLDEPIALKNGDVINLGGGLEIEVKTDAVDESVADDSQADEDEKESSSNANVGAASGSPKASSAGQTSGGSGFGTALILAPILGLLLLISIVGAVVLINGLPEREVAQNDSNDSDFIRTSTPDEEDFTEDNEEQTPDAEEIQTPETLSPNDQNSTNETTTPTDTSTPESTTENSSNTPPVAEESDEIGKIRRDSFKFMRKIARSKQKPVLLKSQLKILENRIKQFKGSSALAGNIKNAQSNASAIQELARSKNLKPQFLITAALAKLGNNRGDVLAKAREMAEPLDNLNIQIGDEQADDNLIIIAAYDQGVRGETLKMRNTLQRLAGKNPNRASEIRTIWFLKEKNEINDAQFDLALRFLAIGTIVQNPAAYNVNAKALNL